MTHLVGGLYLRFMIIISFITHGNLFFNSININLFHYVISIVRNTLLLVIIVLMFVK